MDHVAEAKRRNLSIDDCRVAIGLPKLERAAPSEPRGALCARALNSFGVDWDTSSVWAKDVAEAKRQSLSINDCRVAIGLPKLEPAALPHTGRPLNELCGLALNSRRQDWGIGGRSADYVTEAKRRNLSIDDCRVAMGLPKLERPASPPVTPEPIPTRDARFAATRSPVPEMAGTLEVITPMMSPRLSART